MGLKSIRRLIKYSSYSDDIIGNDSVDMVSLIFAIPVFFLAKYFFYCPSYISVFSGRVRIRNF